MIGKYSPYVTTSPSGKMRLCCRYEDELTGKIKTATVALDKDTKKARREAEIALQRKIEEKLSMPDQKSISLNDLVKLYAADLEADVNITPSTVKRNTIACKTMAHIIGGEVLLDKLDRVDILGKLTATGESAGTKNERLKRFKTLMLWAYRHGYIENVMFLERLTRFKDTPHREKIADKYLETYEYHKICDAMKIYKYNLFFRFQCLSGLRTGEAIALEKGDIDLDRMAIIVNKSYDSNGKTVTHAKTESSIGEVHIQPELLELLHEIDMFYKKQDLRTGLHSCRLLFHGEAEQPFSYYSYRKYLARVSEETIGRKITPHACRHTHASLLFEEGFTYDEVAERLRHKDSRVDREVYVHKTKALRQKENERLDRFRIG